MIVDHHAWSTEQATLLSEPRMGFSAPTGQRLIPRPSFFQLDNLRKARARGEPWHLIVHEDVLVFRAPGFPGSSREPKGSSNANSGDVVLKPAASRELKGPQKATPGMAC
jgi:hypothetical protein